MVSLPATESSTKKAAISGVGEPVAVDLGLDQRGHQVVAGVLLAVLGQLGGELGQRPQRLAEDLDRLAVAEARRGRRP